MIGNKFLSVAGASEPTDAKFNYVTMLLHGDGTNGAQNNTFTDSSTNNFTITRNGNTTQGSFSPYGSNWSNYFSSGAYLTVPDNAGFDLGASDFTIEAWVCCTTGAGNNRTIVAKSDRDTVGGEGTFVIQLQDSNVAQMLFSTGGTGWEVNSSGTTTVALNTWYHIAATRSGSTFRLFVNGALEATATSSITLADNAQVVTIAGLGYTSGTVLNYFSGYISNLRIVKGTAVYTSAFTPSTTPLTAITNTSLLTCQSNRFVDNSASPKTISIGAGTPSVQRFNPFGTSTAYSTATIGGSGYFDGTGDYLSVADNSALDLSTGDFTIECWAYPLTGISDLDGLISKRNQSTFSGSDWRIAYKTASTAFGIATGSNTTDRLTPAIKLNCWNHIAFVRSSGTLKCYANGVLGDSLAWTENLDNAESLLVGLNVAGYDFPGYITDVRINKGTAIYTGAFTPPTLAPLATSGASSAACYPSTTNVNTSFAASTTSLLTSMTNAAIYDNAMMNDLETVGNAQISTSVKKYGTGSLAFDGTGDYLRKPASVLNGFGTGDFTIEFWAYPNGSQTRFASIVNGQNTWYVSYEASNYLFFSDTGTVFIQSSTPLSTSTWTYVAITRSGTALKMFFNGSEVASATNSTNFGTTAIQTLVGFNGTSYYFNGYIDDLRITKGYARTITTPTAAFPDKSSS